MLGPFLVTQSQFRNWASQLRKCVGVDLGLGLEFYVRFGVQKRALGFIKR